MVKYAYVGGYTMEFAAVINYPLLELGLSQIYLNENKVKAIENGLIQMI